MRKIILLLITCIVLVSFDIEDEGVDYWDILGTLEVNSVFNPHTENFETVYTHSNEILNLNNKKIILEGFVNSEHRSYKYVLTRKPEMWDGCIFPAISEIVELKIKDIPKEKQDKRITVEGVLRISQEKNGKTPFRLEKIIFKNNN